MYRASGALLRTIETVVGENPLSFATSRMVTTNGLPRARALNLPPALADTTAETRTGVKRVAHFSSRNSGVFVRRWRTRTRSSCSRTGTVKRAEQDFHNVIAVNPHSAGAYANLASFTCVRSNAATRTLAVCPVLDVVKINSQNYAIETYQ